MEENKYKYQIKHIRNNYKRFRLDFKFDTFNKFQEICKKNNTTPTTEIKKFVDSYIKDKS